MKKIISLTLLLLGGSMLSCLLLMTGCIKQQDAYFIYTKITSSINNRSSDSVVALPPDTIAHSSFTINIHAGVQRSGDLLGSRLSFNNAAYAFQFDDPLDYKNADPIEHIKIITLGKYNDSYPAGSDISGLCIYTPASNVADFSTEQIIEILNFNSVDNQWDNSVGLKNFSVKIAEAPAELGIQRFAIVLESSNNTILKDTTVQVFIKP